MKEHAKIYSQHIDDLVAIESDLKNKIRLIDEKNKKVEESINKQKIIEAELENKSKELDNLIKNNKRMKDMYDSQIAESNRRIKEADSILEANKKSSLINEKQKEYIDNQNSELIKRARFIEMEENRLENLRMYIDKLIADKNLKKEIDLVKGR